MRAVGLGAGGHAAVVIEILRASGAAELVGLLDPRRELHGTAVLGVAVLGGDELLDAQTAAGVAGFCVAVGSTADTSLRRRLYASGLAAGLRAVDAIHPGATLSPSAELGAGLTAMAACVVNARARLGNNVVVNTGAIVEHDCVLSDHAYIASGVRLGAGSIIGEGAHVGLGVSINQGVTIGRGAVVGSGAAVIRDVEPETTVVGVPARLLTGSRT